MAIERRDLRKRACAPVVLACLSLLFAVRGAPAQQLGASVAAAGDVRADDRRRRLIGRARLGGLPILHRRAAA